MSEKSTIFFYVTGKSVLSVLKYSEDWKCRILWTEMTSFKKKKRLMLVILMSTLCCITFIKKYPVQLFIYSFSNLHFCYFVLSRLYNHVFQTNHDIHIALLILIPIDVCIAFQYFTCIFLKLFFVILIPSIGWPMVYGITNILTTYIVIWMVRG